MKNQLFTQTKLHTYYENKQNDITHYINKQSDLNNRDTACDQPFTKLMKQYRSVQQLKLDKQTRMLITYNDMEQELGWLINQWRLQAFIKIFLVLAVLGLFSILMRKIQFQLVLCLFLYSFFKFINMKYILTQKLVRIWSRVSEIAMIYTLCNQILINLMRLVINDHPLNPDKQLIDYSLIPALHSFVIFTLITKIGRKLIMPHIYQTIIVNLVKLPESVKDICQNIWNTSWIIAQLQIVMIIVTYVIMFAVFKVTNTLILFLMLRPLTILLVIFTLFLMILLEHLLDIFISNPIVKHSIRSQMYTKKCESSKTPVLIELMKMNPITSHNEINSFLVRQAHCTCLEWIISQRLPIQKHKTDGKQFEQFLNTKINGSRFYTKYSDIVITQFSGDYLQKFKNILQKYCDLQKQLRISDKLNRSSLVIDAFYIFRRDIMQLRKYLLTIQISEQFEIIDHILQMFSALASNNNIDKQIKNKGIQSMKNIQLIWHKIDAIVYHKQYSKNADECFSKMKNKIQRVLYQYNISIEVKNGK